MLQVVKQLPCQPYTDQSECIHWHTDKSQSSNKFASQQICRLNFYSVAKFMWFFTFLFFYFHLTRWCNLQKFAIVTLHEKLSPKLEFNAVTFWILETIDVFVIFIFTLHVLIRLFWHHQCRQISGFRKWNKCTFLCMLYNFVQIDGPFYYGHVHNKKMI